MRLERTFRILLLVVVVTFVAVPSRQVRRRSGLTVWVYSNSAGTDNGGGGGDVYYISVFGEYCVAD